MDSQMKRNIQSEVWVGSKHRSICSFSWGVSPSWYVDVFAKLEVLWTMCCWDLMEASLWLIINTISSSYPFAGEWGQGWKFQTSNMGWCFQWPAPTQEPPRVTWLEERLSYHPVNYKGFKRSVPGNGAKEQILEQKMLLVLLLLRKLQEFQELWVRNPGQKYIFISYYKSQYHGRKWAH